MHTNGKNFMSDSLKPRAVHLSRPGVSCRAMTDDEPSADESLDLLAGSWRIFQLKRGHRFSTDDLAVAWRASIAAPQARTVLDLGSGIGSVGLLTLWRLDHDAPGAQLTTVEVQEISWSLARRTIARNGLSTRVSPILGDLRDPVVLPTDSQFELITGSPPYLPLGHGRLSPVDQRAGARIELRGSVFDYCTTAARHLAPGGRFCYVMMAQDPRTFAAPAAAGLTILERWDFRFRADRLPHISTVVCGRTQDLDPAISPKHGELEIRGADGEWTDAYLRFREVMGGPPFLARGPAPSP